jgi:hypothetical protein
MLEENTVLRQAYAEKFRDAFDEGIEFGGRNAEFILLKPIKVKGWAFENNTPAENGVPTIPFEFSAK